MPGHLSVDVRREVEDVSTIAGPWRRESQPGSRRAARQRERLQLRLAGRTTFQDVAPALSAVLVALVTGLVWLYLQLGTLGLAFGLLLLAGLVIALSRRRKAVFRRQRGAYTLAELMRMSETTLSAAVARMLSRDGWRVQAVPWQGRPRLLCQRTGGQDLDVTFRPLANVGEEAPVAPLRVAPSPEQEYGTLRLIVSRGTYPRADIIWASRQGGVHLIDGSTLQRWAEGTDLAVLLG